MFARFCNSLVKTNYMDLNIQDLSGAVFIMLSNLLTIGSIKIFSVLIIVNLLLETLYLPRKKSVFIIF